MNKIGSLANGPILGVFLLGILTKRATGPGAILGLLTGFIINAVFWKFVPEVSWPWWNMIGCVICFATGMLVSLFGKENSEEKLKGLTYKSFSSSSAEDFKVNWKVYYYILAGWGAVITGISYAL